MGAYADVMFRAFSQPKYQLLIRLTGRGQFGCTSCGSITDQSLWDKMHCPTCGADGMTHGFLDGDKLAVKRLTAA